MSTEIKTPLQSIVSVICDALSDLTPVDQSRALDAVHVTLGLPDAAATRRGRDPVTYTPAIYDLDQDPIPPQPPIVQVQMMGGQPLVMNPALPDRGRRGLVVIGPQQRRFSMQLTAGTVRETARGYVLRPLGHLTQLTQRRP